MRKISGRVIAIADHRRERPAAPAPVGPAVMVAFPIEGVAARIIDAKSVIEALDRMRPAHPHPTEAEIKACYERRRGLWVGFVQTMRSELRKRKIPADTIDEVIKKFTDDVRVGLAAAREARRNPPSFEAPI